MSGERCRQVWATAPDRDKASVIDAHSPSCGCESHSLRDENFEPVADDEFVARIIISPGGMNLDTREILTGALTSVRSSGVSLIRQGASDEEIELTVQQLTQTEQESELRGAAVFQAQAVREIMRGHRCFCIYDTASGNKNHHADIIATIPNTETRSQAEKEHKARRKLLAKCLQDHFIEVTNVEELKNVIREAGLAN